ncbi:AI-2E family transporter [Antribacter gilvus]|uniref:AI-2E family transporter n=1 Tax=Antribacter gilvus TaxID=2304675 RepID=UPI0030B84F29
MTENSGPETAPSPPAGPAAPQDVRADASARARAAVPYSVQAAAGWAWRILLIGVFVAAGVWLLAALKTIVVPVAVAMLLAVLLTPMRRWYQKHLRVGRGGSSGLSLLSLILIVAGLITLSGRSIAGGFADLSDQAVAGVNELISWVNERFQVDLSDYGDELLSQLESQQSAIITGALGAATTVGHVLVGALIALFCTFFFLHDGRGIWAWLVNLLPLGSRERVHQAGRRGIVTLSAYVRTQILVAFVDGVGIGIGSAFFVPSLALPIAVLVFVGSFVPVVGAIVTGSVAVVVVLVANGWVAALIMLGVVLLVQQIEGHVLQPFLMGQAVSLHPVAVILVVAAGSLAAGIIGALFAVPLAALLNTVILYLHGHDKFPELGTDDRLPLRWRPADAPPLRLRLRGGPAAAQAALAQRRRPATAGATAGTEAGGTDDGVAVEQAIDEVNDPGGPQH